MFTTNSNQSVGFSVSDSTVFVTQGAIQVGSYIMDFKGGNLPFSAITKFDGSANTYQNAVVSIFNYSNFPDLTSSHSTPASDPSGLGSFYLADTSTSKALGFFTFHFDGTNITLKNSSKVF